jgi:dsDNA-binding SOS-regulon protein
MQWDKIMEAAKRLENLLRRADVDLNEAQKAIGYYLFKGCDDSAMERYLKEMAENPPPRSKQTQGYYKKIRHIWQQWSPKCGLTGIDKARAWGWGVRIAKSRLRLP